MIFVASPDNVVEKIIISENLLSNCRFPQKIHLSLQCSASPCGDSSREKLSIQLPKPFQLR